MPIHLPKDTINIASTVNFRKNRSKLTVDVDSYQKKIVDRVFPRSQKNGQLTHGPIGGEKWSRTHIHQEVIMMVPCVVKNGPNTSKYPTAIPIHRFIDPVDRSRSISTVDADSPTENYGLSSIVD